jgi:dimeric dUTPase (all-alpha-NTP-PPase superfamily)
MLQDIFTRQRELQIKSFGVDPGSMSDDTRARYIIDMNLALQDELHEALAEVGWKPWAKSRHFNRDAYVGELVDALHFLVNLFLVADCDATEVAAKYQEKADRNARRQAVGYDGVSDKCRSCGRALDDPAVYCVEGRCRA